MNLINMRSDTHVERLQPKLEEMGFEEGKSFDLTIEEVEEFLGVRLVGELKRISIDLVSLTQDAIISHECIIKEVKKSGDDIFPKRRVLTFYQDGS